MKYVNTVLRCGILTEIARRIDAGRGEGCICDLHRLQNYHHLSVKALPVMVPGPTGRAFFYVIRGPLRSRKIR